MSEVATGLRQVRQRMARAAERVGRDPEDVLLVAVSKKKPAQDVAAALAGGCRDLGESYVQELVAKAAEVAEITEGHPRWHYLGHLQRNKVNALLAVPGLTLVHGVDSTRLLRAIDSRTSGALDVLIHVNVADEESKSGCAVDDLAEIIAEGRRCERVRVRGLMALPPLSAEPEAARPHFRRLRMLRDRHQAGPELSMGMSHDFEIAIEEGATIVRVGTSIFGARGDRP